MNCAYFLNKILLTFETGNFLFQMLPVNWRKWNLRYDRKTRLKTRRITTMKNSSITSCASCVSVFLISHKINTQKKTSVYRKNKRQTFKKKQNLFVINLIIVFRCFTRYFFVYFILLFVISKHKTIEFQAKQNTHLINYT